MIQYPFFDSLFKQKGKKCNNNAIFAFYFFKNFVVNYFYFKTFLNLLFMYIDINKSAFKSMPFISFKASRILTEKHC